MTDEHFIDDPLHVVNVKPDFSGLGMEPIHKNKGTMTDELKIAIKEDRQASTSAEDFLLKDLPPCVSLLHNDWNGETTRVKMNFAVARQTFINAKFDVIGFIKAKFNNTLKAILHSRDIDELRLTPRARVTIDPMNGREKVQIYIHIEYANEKEL